MNILYLTIFVSLILAITFLIIFIISNKSGQFEDTYTPSVRMLFDDETGYKESKKEQTEDQNK